MTAAVAALTKTINAVPVECGSVSYQASSVEYARSVVAYANSSFVDQLDQVTVAQDVLSTAKTALYAIGEPDGNRARSPSPKRPSTRWQPRRPPLPATTPTPTRRSPRATQQQPLRVPDRRRVERSATGSSWCR